MSAISIFLGHVKIAQWLHHFALYAVSGLAGHKSTQQTQLELKRIKPPSDSKTPKVSPIRQPNYRLAKPFRLIRHFAEAQTISPSALLQRRFTGFLSHNTNGRVVAPEDLLAQRLHCPYSCSLRIVASAICHDLAVEPTEHTL